MDFFLIHVLNLFFPFVKILFQSSWNVLHFYWLFYAQFCVIIFISSCLCCVSPFLSHHVRLYLRFYSFIYLFMSMLHFTIFVMFCLCCVLPFLWCYRYPGIHCSSWTRALSFLYPGVGWPWLSSTYIDLSVPVWYN